MCHLLDPRAVTVTPMTTVGVAFRDTLVLYLTPIGWAPKARKRGVVHTVYQTVCGWPTVSVMERWTEIWLPETMILQLPDLMAEKGIPLYLLVSNMTGTPTLP